MIAATCLVLYATAMTWLGPRQLERLTHSGITPQLGIAAWVTAIIGVASAWVGALAIATVDAVRDASRGSPLAFCVNIGGFTRHVGLAQPLGTIVAITGVGAGLVVTARSARQIVSALRRLRHRSHQHAHAARVVGMSTHRSGVVVVSAPEPAVYCVAGRSPAIVVTTAALDSLDEPQLCAVLAHEHAHISGHHHVLLVLLRALATSLPRLPLFTRAAAAVPRLLEMCADDSAARRHGANSLLWGLFTLAGARPATESALGAAHTAVLARAARLATPAPRHLRWRHRLLLTAAIGLTSAIPMLAVALACQL